MKQILCNSGDNIEVNALFIQPTYGCALNCKDCYVKAHAKDPITSYQTDWHEIYKVVEWMALGQNKCHANQITLSVDVLPKNEIGINYQYMTKIMAYFLKLVHIQKRDYPDNKCELHITCNSMHALKGYEKELFFWANIRKLDMISFSNIDLDLAASYVDLGRTTKINYNHLCPTIVNSSLISRQIEHIEQAGQLVNSIYMMTRKKPTSMCFTKEEQLDNASRLQQDMSYIKTILKEVSENVRRKIVVDTCIQDVVGSTRTGFGCSANISKFQVWPDGTVSGCPYAFSGIGKAAKTAEDILENIRLARSHYEFERCHLRRSHDILSR